MEKMRLITCFSKREAKNRFFPSQLSEGTFSIDFLILGLWSQGLGDNKFLLLKPTNVWYFVTSVRGS